MKLKISEANSFETSRSATVLLVILKNTYMKNIEKTARFKFLTIS